MNFNLMHKLAQKLYISRLARRYFKFRALLQPLLNNSFVKSAYGPWLYHFGNDKTLYHSIAGNYGTLISDHIKKLQPGDAFIDVGANVGLYSILAAKQVGQQGRVVAFEPQPKIFETLKNNLAYNRAGWVESFPFALSDQSTTMTMHLTEGHSGSAFLKEHVAENHPDAVKVLAPQELPCFQQDWNKHARIIMKIDTEGNELNILFGFGGFIDAQKNLATIIVEIYPEHLKKFQCSKEDIYDYLSTKGFRPIITEIKRPHWYDQVFVR